MNLDKIHDEANEYSILYRKADYFIQTVKGEKGSVVGIEEYEFDYKFFYDNVTDVKKAREKFSHGVLRPSTVWIVNKDLFRNFIKKESLNIKLKKIKLF